MARKVVSMILLSNGAGYHCAAAGVMFVGEMVGGVVA